MSKKICSMCEILKDVSMFSKCSMAKDGLYSRCKDCKAIESKIRYKNGSHLKYRYGLTIREFNDMISFQKGLCGICKLPPRGAGQYGKLYIDHNHLTGTVRGLLCVRCNTAIGMLNDDPLRLMSAIEYLQKESDKK